MITDRTVAAEQTEVADRVPGPDLTAAGVALALFAVAVVAGALLYLSGHPVRASTAPLFAHWRPRLGPGTPAAVLVAVLVWWRGPELAARLSWRRLTVGSYLAAVGWTLSLALVDGWRGGVAGRLTTPPEYLSEVGGVTDVPAMLRGFTARILDGLPDSWTTHVSGHPPGALLVFVGLDRLGLSGGGWAGLLCILVGAITVVAVPQTVRLLGTDRAARAVVPFLVVFPGAVWIGVSADGLFAGVTSAGVALLAHGVTRGVRSSALAGGVVLGLGVYLSYGLVLMGAVALAVLVLGVHRWRPAGWAVLGAVAVVAAFTVAGFWWLDGYHLVTERYYQGVAARRPYGYWVWADLAILAVSAGPVAAVILRRATWTARRRTAPEHTASGRAAWLLPLSAAVAILAADLSGYSKAEVERIWLPFGVWLMAGASLVPAPNRRVWLAAQAAVALVVNHLLFTAW